MNKEKELLIKSAIRLADSYLANEMAWQNYRSVNEASWDWQKKHKFAKFTKKGRALLKEWEAKEEVVLQEEHLAGDELMEAVQEYYRLKKEAYLTSLEKKNEDS
jgi:hypothetical protein